MEQIRTNSDLPLRSSDASLLTRFAEEYYGEIYRYCARRLRSTEDAKDATQEVFLRLAKSNALYDSKDKPLAYLYTCARNVCIDIQRQDRPVVPFDEGNIERIPDLSQEKNERDLLMIDALSQLPDDEREVLELRYGQDLRMSDIAAILGKSRFALHRIERHALDRLRQIMGDD